MNPHFIPVFRWLPAGVLAVFLAASSPAQRLGTFGPFGNNPSPAPQPPAPPPATNPARPPATNPTQPPANPPPATRNPNADVFGTPLPGLTDDELGQFLDGQADFRVRETAQTGVGPIFNDNSCVVCHGRPAPGGTSRNRVTRFGHADANGDFDPLTSLGGSLLQDRALPGVPRERIPAEANVVARRLTTPVFGDGLIEAIPDATIIANAATAKPAGIHGKVSYVTDVTTGTTQVGRFGWKAQSATLLAFIADAQVNEMGITNRFFPQENAPNGDQSALAGLVATDGSVDDVTDPATGRTKLDRITDFVRLLAPPPQAPARGNSARGEQLFTSLSCVACHTPTMTTGPNAIAALSEKSVPLYSDLLLHDMGTLGDGIAQAAAGPTEMRTAPLWGLRARREFLHDGRAATVDEAIRDHAGEAANARNAYENLSTADQRALLDFLDTL